MAEANGRSPPAAYSRDMPDAPWERSSPVPPFLDELQRARRGDADALDRLVRRVLPQLDRRSREELGPWLAGRLGASDLVQDALVEVVRGITKFEGDTEAAFVAWVDKIVERAALQQHRKLRADRRRAPTQPDELQRLAAVLQPAPSPPSAVARQAEFTTLLETALSELTIDQRLALTRVVFEQQPVAQVAAELGRSTDALHTLLGRARARLALRLEQLGAYRS